MWDKIDEDKIREGDEKTETEREIKYLPYIYVYFQFKPQTLELYFTTH